MATLESQYLRVMAPFLIVSFMSYILINNMFLGTVRHLFLVQNEMNPSVQFELHRNVTTRPRLRDTDAVLKDLRIEYRSRPKDAEGIIKFVYFENRLNHSILTWKEVEGMQIVINRYWKGNLFCSFNKIRSMTSGPNYPITLNVTFGCKELYEESRIGSVNFINLLYGIRLAAHVYGNVDVYLTCHDANEKKRDLILPWLMGWLPSRPAKQKSSIPVSTDILCNNYSSPKLSYMYKEMQYDLRKMAVGLMGIPHPEHPSAVFAERFLWSKDWSTELGSMANRYPQLPLPQRNDLPPFPASSYELDDAVLHFRCGDLMDSTDKRYAFMKFNGYVRHISSAAKSIGILTQPFDGNGAQGRKADADSKKRDRCRIVVHSLVQFIEERYPHAKVNIRNSEGETIALTYARMIMANQTIAGISSFGVLPAIATFGTGYLREPDYPSAPQRWLLHPRIDELAENVVLFKEPKFIKVEDMKDLWEKHGEAGVLKWFWDEAFSHSQSV